MSQTEKLTLYSDSFRDSPFVFTAFVALREKGLDFDLLDIDLRAGQHRQPDYVARSLTGKVPVLCHGDFWLSESMAIAEYLAETFPFPDHPRIFPANLQERARCRQVMMWLRTDLLALRKELQGLHFWATVYVLVVLLGTVWHVLRVRRWPSTQGSCRCIWRVGL